MAGRRTRQASQCAARDSTPIPANRLTACCDIEWGAPFRRAGQNPLDLGQIGFQIGFNLTLEESAGRLHAMQGRHGTKFLTLRRRESFASSWVAPDNFFALSAEERIRPS
jgi:hypothetical protein